MAEGGAAFDTSAGSFASRTLKAAKKMTSPAMMTHSRSADEASTHSPSEEHRDRAEKDRPLVAGHLPDRDEGEHQQESRADGAEVYARMRSGRQSRIHEGVRHHDEKRHQDRVQPEDADVEPQEFGVPQHGGKRHGVDAAVPRRLPPALPTPRPRSRPPRGTR